MATDPRFLAPTPFSRLVSAHAVSMCGDACIAASLAGSLFFSSPTSSSREKVLLYLLVTMLPFAVVAPVLGPALDYRRSGRRVLVVVSMLGRAVLAVLMARWISDPAPEGLLVYPLAFGILVLAKGYSVAKSALVPALVDDTGELVRANSRLALVSVIATTVGGGPAFLLQEVAGPEWSLWLAAVVFVVGGLLATKIPRVRIELTPHEAEREREELHQPSILLAGSAMAVMRAAVGFLAFFAAFSLKNDLFALGVAATMAVIGGFVGNIAGPPLRRLLREEQMLAASLLVTASLVLVGALLDESLAFAVSSLAVAIGAAAGRLSFDSLLQRDGPDAVRGRAFARFETRFQVAWVIGALVGIIPQNEKVGMLLLALALGLAGVSYVATRRAARGREMRTTLRPEAVDRAVGRATRRMRKRWGSARRHRRQSRAKPPEPEPAAPEVEAETRAPEYSSESLGTDDAAEPRVPEPPETFPGGA
jgi:putative Mn2+ efflux pump MntP